MLKFLANIFGNETIDQYVEGIYAHQYKDDRLRQEILHKYNQQYRPEPTPFSHPEQYDPLSPPDGWAYDPYYEIWIRTNDM